MEVVRMKAFSSDEHTVEIPTVDLERERLRK